MSIASEITRLQNAKTSIVTTLTNKGVTVPEGTKLEGINTLISTDLVKPVGTKNIDTYTTFDVTNYANATVTIPQYDETTEDIYTITTHCTSCTGSASNPTTMLAGTTATLTFTVAVGCEFPDTITVVGATGTWTKATGTLILSNPTNNITITITCALPDGFVALVYPRSSNTIKVSKDTNGWQDINTTPSTTEKNKLIYKNGRFICLGAGGVAYYSIDNMATWSAMSGLISSVGGYTISYNSLTYGLDKFWCIGSGGPITVVYQSIDGETWTNKIELTCPYMQKIAYFNNRFIMVGNNGSSYYSFDGISWTAMTGLDTNEYYKGIAYGNGRYVCTGEDSSYYSLDGTSWTAMTGMGSSYDYPYLVTYTDNAFVAVRGGSNNISYYSTDGETWVAGGSIPTTYIYGIAYNSNLHKVAVVGRYQDASTAISLYSTDNGVTWNEIANSGTSTLSDVVAI